MPARIRRGPSVRKAAWDALRPLPRSFLVIDDDRDIRSSMRTLLELYGRETCEAASGTAGLEILKDEPPDVALIDINMPGMNGYEVARRARMLPRGGDLVLVAVTAYGSFADKERAWAAGFDLRCTKPCDYHDLTAALDRLDLPPEDL